MQFFTSILICNVIKWRQMWFSNLFFFLEILFQKISLSKKEIISEALVYSKKFLACTEKMLENALCLKTYTTKICHPHVTLVSRKCSNFCTIKNLQVLSEKSSVANSKCGNCRIFLPLRFYVKYFSFFQFGDS